MTGSHRSTYGYSARPYTFLLPKASLRAVTRLPNSAKLSLSRRILAVAARLRRSVNESVAEAIAAYGGYLASVAVKQLQQSRTGRHSRFLRLLWTWLCKASR